jgi:hypothetical protein
MKKKKAYIPVLDLHHLHHEGFDFAQKLHITLDRFLIKSKQDGYKEVIIIVGRGLNSTSSINKMHPTLYHTRDYLDRINFDYRYSNEKGTCNVYLA